MGGKVWKRLKSYSCICRSAYTYKKEDGRYTVHISHGGLVTALKQVLHKRKALWIGWAGSEKITPKMKNLIFEEGKRRDFFYTLYH